VYEQQKDITRGSQLCCNVSPQWFHGHHCKPVGMILLSLIENESMRFNRGVLIAKSGPHTGSYSGLYCLGRHMLAGQTNHTAKPTFCKKEGGDKNPNNIKRKAKGVTGKWLTGLAAQNWHSGRSITLTAAATWWFSSGDMSLYITANGCNDLIR